MRLERLGGRIRAVDWESRVESGDTRREIGERRKGSLEENTNRMK